MGRNPTSFPHACGIRLPTAHPAPRPSPVPVPFRPLPVFPAESARFRRPLHCRIPASRRGATAVSAGLFDRTRPEATGFRPTTVSATRCDPMAGSRPVPPRRTAGRQGRNRSFRNFTPRRGAAPGGTLSLRNFMAGRGPAPRICPAAQGAPKATGGKRSGHPEQRTSERKLTTCQTTEPIC